MFLLDANLSYVETLTKTPEGIAISPDGDRIWSVATDAFEFVYNPALGAQGSQKEAVTVKSDFGGGFFTCGATVLNANDFPAGNEAQYPFYCGNNGVVGQVHFLQEYYFTDHDASEYSLGQAAGKCNALYAPIAETISDLPPYSCSRTIRQSTLACLATAVANTQVLFQVLVFLSTLLLARLAPRYPPAPGKHGAPAATSAPAVIEMSAAHKSAADHDIENPMVK